ncbi:MAG: dihydrodipicolinate synthase family protein [Acidimicrobiia bacterium]|nr:dihydrodipicolinate synthase family protein [Acidimicrobiia bacterium]
MRTPPRMMPALVTPFTGNGNLNLNAHAANLTALSERGITGFLIGGSTGEGPYLENGERRTLLETARTTLGSTPFLIAGIVSESLRGALRQIDEAADGGADAVLVLTPTTLTRGRDEYVEGFFKDVAKASALPVLIYSVPLYSAYEPPIQVFARIAALDNVVGMKDSGGNPARKAQIIEATGDDFVLFAGSSKAIALSVTAGAYGSITASGNYAPELVQGLVRKARRSATSATEAQAQLTKLSLAVEQYGIPGVKVAAEAAGLTPGSPRKPLKKLPKRTATQVRAAMGL